MNTVENLLKTPFKTRPYEDKIKIKSLGPDRPDLHLTQTVNKGGGKKTDRKFNKDWYNKKTWLTGCAESNSLFCFCCLLYGGDDTWAKKGTKDIKHLSERVRSHECSKIHINNATELAMLGRVNVGTQLDTAYQQSIRRHNEKVDKNRYVFSKIIDCIKFCGAFELALRGHDESEESTNKGIFLGLVDFAAELDTVLKDHLQLATVFKGTSKTIQNEVLDCMFEVCRENILEEIKSSKYVAVQADETTDCSTTAQLVLIYRYVVEDKGIVETVERFFGFYKLVNVSAEAIAHVISNELEISLGHEKSKLIAQTYDGAAVMSGSQRGVNTLIKGQYPYAYYIHCYAHQLNLTMLQASSSIPEVRLFFMNIGGFPAFFNRSPRRTMVLDSVLNQRRIPKESGTRWNFNSRLVQTVYEYKEGLIECFQKICTSCGFNAITVREATGLLALLETNASFLFWLNLFYKIMPHVDILYAQMQKRDTDPVQISSNVEQFQKALACVRSSLDYEIDNADPKPRNKRMKSTSEPINKQIVAKEVCDIVTVQAKERFSFSGHLTASKLFYSNMYPSYSKHFPESELNSVIKAYPFFDKLKLKTELTTLYSREDFHLAVGAMPLLRFLLQNNLEETYSETISLLRVLVTTPMTTSESERCFSTLKRIKTFLRSTMTEDRLNALAMIAIERKMCQNKDFNTKVIDKFSQIKERRLDFLYK